MPGPMGVVQHNAGAHRGEIGKSPTVVGRMSRRRCVRLTWHMSGDLTGEQYVVESGPARAVVTEVGAGLREFTVDGEPYVETFGPDVLPPKGCGAILVPWPNRVRGGRWTLDGVAQQLAHTEPARGNAIHGLGRYLSWQPDPERTSDAAVTLRAVLNAQPGWPVRVAASVRYAVDAAGLTVTHTLRNLGARPIPVGVGAHPYLRAGHAATDDCTLRLAASTEIPLDPGSMTPSGPPVPVAADRDFRDGRGLRGVELDTPFGGCVPAEGDDLVRHRLTGPDGGVELWAEPVFGWVQVFTPDDFPGRGRAVAVEPMTCPPDALNSGDGLITLGPGETWTGRWGLTPVVPDRT